MVICRRWLAIGVICRHPRESSIETAAGISIWPNTDSRQHQLKNQVSLGEIDHRAIFAIHLVGDFRHLRADSGSTASSGSVYGDILVHLGLVDGDSVVFCRFDFNAD